MQGGTRARDADRDAVVEALEEAYVDGQLDAEDREARVARALAARTLEELRGLTADLQHEVVVARPRRGIAAVVAPIVVVAAVVAIAVAAAANRDEEPAPAPEPQRPAPVAEPVPSPPSPSPTAEVTEPPVREFSLTLRELRRFRERYEAKFDTTQAYSVTMWPDRIAVDVPVRGSRPRVEGWDYEGSGFERTSEAKALTRSLVIIDLAWVDFARMLDNIEEARRTLNVPKAELSHISYDHLDISYEGVEVDIYVDNAYDEGGRLTTRPDGTIVQRWPYEG